MGGPAGGFGGAAAHPYRRDGRPDRGYAAIGQPFLRSYQLCVKHTNDKGGVLGRQLELVVHDDASDPATAVRLYEQLITRDKVSLVLGPQPSAIAEAVANVTEKHKMPMVAAGAGAASISRKGRSFIFSMMSPGGVHLEGLIDLAAKKGLKTLALINRDDLGERDTTQGAIELAKKRSCKWFSPTPIPRGPPTSPRSSPRSGRRTPTCWVSPQTFFWALGVLA